MQIFLNHKLTAITLETYFKKFKKPVTRSYRTILQYIYISIITET